MKIEVGRVWRLFEKQQTQALDMIFVFLKIFFLLIYFNLNLIISLGYNIL